MATSHSDPDTTPAMPAPPGLHSQLSNPPSHNFAPIIVLVLAIVLSAPFVSVRFYTRHFITKKLWWDDWTCLLGWMFLVAMSGLLLDGLACGLATDRWNVSKANYAQFDKLFHDIEIVARVGMFFTKASILLFYQRLFIPSGTRRTAIWYSIWFTFWWNLLYAVALVLAVAFECTGKGEIVARGGQCVDEYAVLICASVINVTTDLMILVIPIAAIWALHMPVEKKWKLSVVFAVGTFGVMASVARLGYQVAEAKKPNQTIIVMILSLMNIAEQFIGIIVSCMPILPAFYRHITTRGRKSTLSISSPPRTTGASSEKKSGVSSLFGLRSGGSRNTPKDPYPLYSTRGYEELDVIEAQRAAKGGIRRDVDMHVAVDDG